MARTKLPPGWDGYDWQVSGKPRFSIDHPTPDGMSVTRDPAFPGIPASFTGYGATAQEARENALEMARGAGLPIEEIA